MAMKNSLGEKIWARGIISSHLGIPRTKILFTRHHDAHAAAAFFPAPVQRAALLTADGVGEWATVTTGIGERRAGAADLTLSREIRFPHSLGMLYSTFTAYLGFAVNEDEYKVMGLAAYGQPTMVDRVRRVIRRTPDGAFALVPEYFEFHTTGRAVVLVALHRSLRGASCAVRADRRRDAGGPAFRRLRRKRPARARRHARRPCRGAPPRDRPAGSLLRRRRRTQWRGQRADPRRVRVRSRLRPAGARRRGLRARRRALCGPHLLQAPGPRRARSSLPGPGG